MQRHHLDDLAAFAVVAEDGSFTRAAARLGMSQSALSHAMRALEERLKVRLLARTTRSVSTTEAGEALLRYLKPALQDISLGLAQVGAYGVPSGTLRITATRNAVRAVLLPALPAFQAQHPNVTLELVADDELTDIVAAKFDAGIRLGDIVEKDMIAVRVGPDWCAAVVGSPAYFEQHPPPRTPQELSGHRCINYRLIKSGALYAWEFEKDGQELEVRVDGALVFNDVDLMLEAAVHGLGIAYVYEDDAEKFVRAEKLVRVLEDWCSPFPGYFLYHTSRRQVPPALTALIEAIRYRPVAGQSAP